MARYKVILAYDGTDFYGFQRQAGTSKTRTVQGVFETALRRIGWQGRSILAAGRTDTGVHASGQVIAFDHEWRHTTQDLKAALNANLPADAVVRSLRETKADFHPRYDALSRCYRYQIYCQPVRDPLRARFAWRVWPQPDLARMQRAAVSLVGEHDFAAFGAPTRPGGATIRRVLRAEWVQEADTLTFWVVGNAFLYHMVRRLVGYQVDIGQSKVDLDHLKTMLDESGHPTVQRLAPPNGLTLMQVVYRP